MILFPLILTGNMSTAGAASYENDQQYTEDAQNVAAIGRKRGNYVFAPVPVSNPTVGTGLIGVLMYLHPRDAGAPQAPNATSGLALMYTNNDSWLASLFHNSSWDGDRYRVTGIFGYGDFNLKYYGIGDSPALSDDPIDYNIAGLLFAPELLVRVASFRHWYAGLHYIYFDSDIGFDSSSLTSLLPDVSGDVVTAGLGPVISYDSRDDNYYPADGSYLYIRWLRYGEYVGGDFEYDRLKAIANHYYSANSRTVLAVQADFEDSAGDVPFFDLPSLDIRGLPRGQYVDSTTLTVRGEIRYRFHPRWGTLLFVDAGWYADQPDQLSSSETITSVGTGLSWQVTADKKLNLGLEIAFSEDDSQVFIQIGEKF